MPEKRTQVDREFREGAVRIVNENQQADRCGAQDFRFNEARRQLVPGTGSPAGTGLSRATSRS